MPTRSVLLVTYHFPPDSESGAARPHRFYRYLPEFGYSVHVITAAPAAANSHIHPVPIPASIGRKMSPLGFTERVLRKFCFPHDEAMLWSWPVVRAAEKLISEGSIRAIFSTAPPLNTHLAALWLKRRYGLPWIADFRDPLRDNSFRATTGLPGAVDRTVEAAIFDHADALIAVTDAIAGAWCKNYPQWKQKFHIIWNGFDPQEIVRPEPTPQREYKLMAHVGNLYGVRQPVKVLSALQKLRGHLTAGVRVLLVGHMDEQIRTNHAALFAELEARGSLECRPVVPRAEALRLMSQADYLLLLDIHESPQAYAVPAKLFEYLRLGRPILALTTPGSPVDRILERAGVPYRCIYHQDNDEKAAATLASLLQLSTDPVSPSQWFGEQFDGRSQTAALARLLDTMAGEEPS
jgi:glycosyltransferase involved in cell wall biosynthesis